MRKNKVSDIQIESNIVSTEDAKKILQDKAKDDITSCQQDINVALKKYGCKIDAQFLLAEGSVRSIVQVVKNLDMTQG